MNNFISFVSAFKKFKGIYNTIQHSALYSWDYNGIWTIVPTVEVDAKANCSKYANIITVDGIKRGRELGFKTQSPIIKDMIGKALAYVDTPMVALINSDIIIPEDFSEKIEKAFHKYGYDIYIVGSRRNIQLTYFVNSVETYKKVYQEKSISYDPSTSSDIFIASKFTWRKIIKDMPEFILGRFGWDNWLHMFAEVNCLNKYNCTKVIPILHCDHGLGHILLQEGSAEKHAPSSMHNLNLYKATHEVYGTTDIKYWPSIEI